MYGGVDIEQSPFRQRGFVAAAVFLGLIAVAGSAVVIAGVVSGGRARPSGRSRGGVTAGSAWRAAPATVAHAPAVGGVCAPLPAGGQAVPTLPPAGAGWALVGDMAEPSAPSTIGPARRVDGFGECYAHSPVGALYAAENVIAAFSAAPQSTVIAALAAPGHAREVAVEQAASGDIDFTSRAFRVRLVRSRGCGAVWRTRGRGGARVRHGRSVWCGVVCWVPREFSVRRRSEPVGRVELAV